MRKKLLVGIGLVGITIALIAAGSNTETKAKQVWLYPCNDQPSAKFHNVTIIEKTANSITFKTSDPNTSVLYGSVIEHHGSYTIEN